MAENFETSAINNGHFLNVRQPTKITYRSQTCIDHGKRTCNNLDMGLSVHNALFVKLPDLSSKIAQICLSTQELF